MIEPTKNETLRELTLQNSMTLESDTLASLVTFKDKYEPEWIQQIQDLHNKTELKRQDRKRLHHAYVGSFATVTCWLQSRLIASARMISDGAQCSMIFDMVVDPEFQRLGIGTEMMNRLITKTPNNFIHLTSTVGKEPFYAKLGFKKHKTAMALYPAPLNQTSPYLEHKSSLLQTPQYKWACEPLDLKIHSQGDTIHVRTLRTEDIEGLAEVLDDPNGWPGKMWGIDTPKEIQIRLRNQLKALTDGRGHPLIYFINGKPAGTTTYMRLEPKDKTLEIGFTWVAPNWRRTMINSHVKYLLIKNAFEVLGAERIEFRVDINNYASQMNILRLGATPEGMLRSRLIGQDLVSRDGYIYSLIKRDWPSIQNRFQCLLENKLPPANQFLPSEFHFENQTIYCRTLKLADSAGLLDLVERNRNEFNQHFRRTSAAVTSLETAQRQIAILAHDFATKKSAQYGVWVNNSDKQIGLLQIKNFDQDAGQAELGYFIDPCFRKQGLATKVVGRALDHLFENHDLTRVYIRVRPDNFASLHAAEKLGFKREGVMRAAYKSATGELQDLVLLARTTN